jgi:hypothetical protein
MCVRSIDQDAASASLSRKVKAIQISCGNSTSGTSVCGERPLLRKLSEARQQVSSPLIRMLSYWSMQFWRPCITGSCFASRL